MDDTATFSRDPRPSIPFTDAKSSGGYGWHCNFYRKSRTFHNAIWKPLRYGRQSVFIHMGYGQKTWKMKWSNACIIAGIRFLQKYADTETFRNIGAKVIDKGSHPSCTQHKYDSDEYWKCFIRHNTLPGYHSTSTCKMGKSYKSSVVDSQLR